MGKRNKRRNRKRRQYQAAVSAHQRKPRKKEKKVLNVVSEVKLATTIRTLAYKNLKMLEDIKSQLDSGEITSFVILAPGKWSKKARETIRKSLDKKNLGWVYKHIVFPINSDEVESDLEFIERIFNLYNITHFLDASLELLKMVLSQREFTKINLWSFIPHKDSWEQVKTWLIKTAPKYLKTFEPYENSFSIINTGVAATT